MSKKKKKMVEFNESNVNTDLFATEESMSKFLDQIMEKEDEYNEEVDYQLPPIPEGIAKEILVSPAPIQTETKAVILNESRRNIYRKTAYSLYLDEYSQMHFTDNVTSSIGIPLLPVDPEKMNFPILDTNQKVELAEKVFVKMIDSMLPSFRVPFLDPIKNYLMTHKELNPESGYEIIMVMYHDVVMGIKTLAVYKIPHYIRETYNEIIDILLKKVDLNDENDVFCNFMYNISVACDNTHYYTMDYSAYSAWMSKCDGISYEDFKYEMDKCTLQTESEEESLYNTCFVTRNDIIEPIFDEYLHGDDAEEDFVNSESEGASNDENPFQNEESGEPDTTVSEQVDAESESDGDGYSSDDAESEEDSEQRCDDDVVEEQEETEIEKEEPVKIEDETNQEIEDEEFEDFEIEGSEEVEEGDMVIPVTRS